MPNPRLRMGALVALALSCVLALGGVALAASRGPILKSPRQGQRVHAGHIRLVVYAPGAAAAVHHDVFLELSTKRLVKHGTLLSPNTCTSCDFVTMKRWAHHRGYWIYTAPFNFPGYWAVTPGKYYWQIHYYLDRSPWEVLSAIHAFRVTG